MFKIRFLPFFAYCLLGLTFPLSATYGLLQGQSRERFDQQEREFYADIFHTYSPFYTGPLLAPSANVVPKGKVNIQPYLFWKKVYGTYNREWKKEHALSSVTLQPFCIFQYGLTDFLEVNVSCQAFYNQKGTQHNFNYGDMSIAFGFQILKDFLVSMVPACVGEVGVSLPTGKYQKLSNKKNGTDSTGAGAFVPNVSLNFQKNFNKWFKKRLDPLHYHPFLLRLSVAYDFQSAVKVKGINTYGGTRATNGRVKPGGTFTTIFAWEYSLTERWVFATDWQYTASSKTTFSGKDGGATVGGPANENFSVAPAIEFNINSNVGVLAGAWFSFAGRNSNQFVNGIFSFTWLF
jgi:hypothetical protein